MTDAAHLAACRAAPDLFKAVETALGQIVGHKLFTLMAIDWEGAAAARIYTSHPEAYPVGGRKALGALTAWGEIVLRGRQPWIGNSTEDIRDAFPDHELIASLGCAACLNLPVIDAEGPGGARVIGTVNLLHEAGHFRPEHITRATPFAALLLQPYRDWAAGAR
ncbi:MAG: GAF domain-containing protein [Pseudomonadota bacterium]